MSVWEDRWSQRQAALRWQNAEKAKIEVAEDV